MTCALLILNCVLPLRVLAKASFSSETSAFGAPTTPDFYRSFLARKDFESLRQSLNVRLYQSVHVAIRSDAVVEEDAIQTADAVSRECLAVLSNWNEKPGETSLRDPDPGAVTKYIAGFPPQIPREILWFAAIRGRISAVSSRNLILLTPTEEPVYLDSRRPSKGPAIMTRFPTSQTIRLEIKRFDFETARQFKLILSRIQSNKSVRVIVIGLRSCDDEGYIDAASQFCSFFRPAGTPFLEVMGRSFREHVTLRNVGFTVKIPVVVIVGESTGRFGEMVAAFFREQLGAVLIGSSTSGGGVITQRKYVDAGDDRRLSIIIPVATLKTGKGHDLRQGLKLDI